MGQRRWGRGRNVVFKIQGACSFCFVFGDMSLGKSSTERGVEVEKAFLTGHAMQYKKREIKEKNIILYIYIFIYYIPWLLRRRHCAPAPGTGRGCAPLMPSSISVRPPGKKGGSVSSTGTPFGKTKPPQRGMQHTASTIVLVIYCTAITPK